MGLLLSKAERRLDELQDMKDYARSLMKTWQQRAFQDMNAGVAPGTPGSALAVWDAALQHYEQTVDEERALRAHLADPSQPMPNPTPRLHVVLPPPRATAVPPLQPSVPAHGEEPLTPQGDASQQGALRRRGASSSREQAAAAGALEGSEAEPLLAASAGQAASKMRRRQGHGGPS